MVQPLVGYYSDKCRSGFGRRRPFIAAGALLVAVAVFLIGYGANIGVSTGDKIGAPRKPRAIAIFIIGFWILDVANNTLQGPCRAPLADLAGSSSTKVKTGNAMFAILRQISRPMWVLMLVTCLNWVAWFPFLLFDTDWMAKDVYGGKFGGRLYNKGVRAGATGLILNSVVSGVASLCIEHLARWVGGVKRLWAGMNFLLAFCLAMTILVTHMANSEREFTKSQNETMSPTSGVIGGAMSIFAVLGAPLAVTFSVPCALASIFSNNSRAGQGLSLGLLNLAIVIPQIVVSLLSGPLDSLWGGSNLPAFGMGAMTTVASGIVAFTMLPSPPSSIVLANVSGGGMH